MKNTKFKTMEKKSNSKLLLFAIPFSMIALLILIYNLDKNNFLSTLGLSPTLWSTVLGMSTPMFLTIYLWNREKMERIDQFNENNKLQQQLINRSYHYDYIIETLDWLYKLRLDLESMFTFNKHGKDINDEDSERIEYSNRLITWSDKINYADNPYIWNIEFDFYAFSSIGIDVKKFCYNDEIIDLSCRTNLVSMFLKDVRWLSIYSTGITAGNSSAENDLFSKREHVVKQLLKDQERITELKQFIKSFREDVEDKIVVK